jgi:hypothetical protein
MTKPWKPDEFAPAAKPKSWPTGATAGLLIVAAACVGLAVVLYQVAGPSDVFEKDAPFE